MPKKPNKFWSEMGELVSNPFYLLVALIFGCTIGIYYNKWLIVGIIMLIVYAIIAGWKIYKVLETEKA